MAGPLEYLLGASPEDFDCAIVLELPTSANTQYQDESFGTFSKRQRTERQQQQHVELKACSMLLKTFSPKFRDWMARWTDPATAKELRFQCRDEEECAGYKALLAFIHSLGKEVPSDVDALLQLLLVAREHAVEPAVLACVDRLQQQATQLPAKTCLQLLTALETGVSGHTSIEAVAQKLLSATCDRLCGLLAADVSLAADADVQQHMLHFIGPLQDMLNDEMRRRVFLGLPFGLLRDYFIDNEIINADMEATVLAAFAFWSDERLQVRVLTCGDFKAERIASICHRIRFPAIPAHVLVNYHACFKFMKYFDPQKELLMRAIASASDPALGAAWQTPMSLTTSAAMGLKATCEHWWTPRPQLFPGIAAPATFELEIMKPTGSMEALSERRYWNAYYWAVRLSNKDDNLRVSVVSTVTRVGATCPDNNKADVGLYSIQAGYTVLLLSGTDLGGDSMCATQADSHYFAPTRGVGWGCDYLRDSAAPDHKVITWEDFWAADSRFLRNGAARVRLELRPAGA